MKSWNPKRACLALAALLVVWSPEISQACSVCTSGRDEESRMAFIITTAFLTFLPLTIVGIFFWFLRRRYLELESEQAVTQTN